MLLQTRVSFEGRTISRSRPADVARVTVVCVHRGLAALAFVGCGRIAFDPIERRRRQRHLAADRRSRELSRAQAHSESRGWRGRGVTERRARRGYRSRRSARARRAHGCAGRHDRGLARQRACVLTRRHASRARSHVLGERLRGAKRQGGLLGVHGHVRSCARVCARWPLDRGHVSRRRLRCQARRRSGRAREGGIVQAIAVAPDGKSFASGAVDGEILL